MTKENCQRCFRREVSSTSGESATSEIPLEWFIEARDHCPNNGEAQFNGNLCAIRSLHRIINSKNAVDPIELRVAMFRTVLYESPIHVRNLANLVGHKALASECQEAMNNGVLLSTYDRLRATTATHEQALDVNNDPDVSNTRYAKLRRLQQQGRMDHKTAVEQARIHRKNRQSS